MNRFALSAAGLAAVSMGGSALAAVVNGEHGLDRWSGEHSWQITDSGSNIVASMDWPSYNGVSGFTYTTNSAATSHWGTVNFTMDLAAGDYTVTMQDSYGDGWVWGSYSGYLAVSGSNVDGGSASGTVASGSSAGSFSFTVIPAPGAMALLGLAGLAGRRRRRA
jgi:hypothetical protein